MPKASPPHRVLFVTANPGSVSAVLPAFDLAQGHYECRHLDMVAAERPYPVDKAAAEINAFGPAVLVTGTGGLESQDKAFLEAAFDLGLPTLAVVDFWANADARFQRSDGGLYIPDIVAVPDEVAARDLAALGMPEDRMISVGLGRYDKPPAPRRDAEKKAARQRLGISEEAFLAVTPMQPFIETYRGADRARQILGYHEDDILDGLAAALNQLGAEKPKFHLRVKRHPLDPRFPAEGDTRLDGLNWAVLPPNVGFDTAMDAADLVLGANSSVMMDSYAHGIPTISFQPGLKMRDPLPLSRDGLIARYDDPAGLAAAVCRMMQTGDAGMADTFPMWMDGMAPRRILALIDALIDALAPPDGRVEWRSAYKKAIGLFPVPTHGK